MIGDVADDAPRTAVDARDPDWDTLTGIVTDGVVGAVGGAVGTAALTVGLLVAATLDAFAFGAFATLASLTGLDVLAPSEPTAVGYLLFLVAGTVTWPLLFASIGSYLPGRRFATRGLPFGAVLWTGFVLAFYAGQTGTSLALYVVLTLVGHLGYGFTLGSVFDYLSSRPATLV